MSENKPDKLWETKEWRDTRDRLLKDYCEMCGKRNVTLVLTHTKPFPKAKIIGRRMRAEFISELISKSEIKEFSISGADREKFLINRCTICSSQSLRERKVKKPRFYCNNCKSDFDTPEIVFNEYDPEFLKMRNHYYNGILENYREEIDNRYNKKMDELKKWYLSGEDTITYCSSCSFNYKKGRILCSTCKKHFHNKGYEQCFYCNSVECIQCGKNRILKRFDQDTCDSCLQNSSKEKMCESCSKNNVFSDLKICDECVLQGKWVD